MKRNLNIQKRKIQAFHHSIPYLDAINYSCGGSHVIFVTHGAWRPSWALCQLIESPQKTQLSMRRLFYGKGHITFTNSLLKHIHEQMETMIILSSELEWK